MEPFAQKSIYIYQNEAIEGGKPEAIAAVLVAAGFEAVYLHTTNGPYPTNRVKEDLVAALKAAGLIVYGWGAVYGDNIPGEALAASTQVKRFKLAGHLFDAETAFDSQPNAVENTKQLVGTFRAQAPGVAVGWCWWAHHHYTNSTSPLHPVGVLRAAMELCDVGAPMAYWNWGDDPASAVRFLNECVKQWREVTNKPIVPAGRAFIGVNGRARPESVEAFARRAIELGCPGISWWSMQHALDGLNLPGVWEALSETPKMGGEEEPMVDYKTYPMGLVTKTTARVKEPFGFVVYDLGGNDDDDPNEQAAPIEADALASGKAPIAKWRFTTHWYGQNQKSATDAAWPKKEGDLPFQAFVSAARNRSPYAVVIEIMDGTNFEGKPEDPFYLSYAAEQFVARVDGWLKANKPGVKVLVGSSNAFIEQSSPRDGDMNAWVGKYPSYIIQPSPAVDSSFPAGTAKPAHLDNRLTWEMWQYAGNLAIFNVASCGPINTWLNYTPGTPPVEEPGDGEPEPEEDTEELKLLRENNALLKKIAAHFA